MTHVEKGDIIVLKALVEQPQIGVESANGVFAVYTDISYTETAEIGGPVFSVVAGTVTHPSPYQNGVNDGINSYATEIPAIGIDGAGGFAGFSYSDGNERAFWTIKLKAETAGEANFTPNRDNMVLPSQDVLLYGYSAAVSESEIEYRGCTLKVGSAEKARVRLDITDEVGSPLSNVNVGDDFHLRCYVKDVRTPGTNYGVMAAHTDVTFDNSLIEFETDWDGDYTHGDQAFTYYEPFNYQHTGFVRNDLEYLDDAGALTAEGYCNHPNPHATRCLDPDAEHLVFSIKCTAVAPGTAQITPNMPTLLGRSAGVAEPAGRILMYGAGGIGANFETLSELEVDFQSVSFTINSLVPTGDGDGTGQCVAGYWQHGDSTNVIVNPWNTLKLAIKDLIDGSSTSEVVTINYSYVQPFIAHHVINNIVYDAAGRPGGAYEINADGHVQHYDTYFLGDGGQSDELNVLDALQRSEHDLSFRHQINLAFQQWKELFEDLWPGLTLNFVDLGLETGTPPPTSV